MAAKKLEEYNKKRDFKKTREPQGEERSSRDALRFVVQRHDASRLHYDFRLEYDGVLWSWAVPKGPSYNPKDKRLAVHVEDHPLDYRNFEGTIPEGEYGGGTVQLFDEGIWIPEGDPARELADGSLKFTLEGQRLQGRWTLIRMKPKPGEEDKNWLLIKEKDEFVRTEDGVTTVKTSVRTGRTLAEIAAEETPTSFAGDEGTAEETEEAVDQADKPGKSAQPGKPDKPEKSTKKARSAQAKVPPVKMDGALPFHDPAPMLATLTKAVPKGSDWVHELKFDGYRILAVLEDGKVHLMSRNGHDWSDKAPAIVKALEAWSPGNLILDGELVVFDKNGKSDFQALQSYFKKPAGKQLDYVVFDLLALGDQDLRKQTLLQRKERLQELLTDAPGGIHYSHHTEGGPQIFGKACDANMEGIISKKKDAPYRSTRSRDWLKVKCEFRQEFVIGGYTVTDQNKTGLSSLLLGYHDQGELRYRGRAGTGFSQAETADLLRRFKGLKRKTSPFSESLEERSGETIQYLTPSLIAEIQYAEITDEGLLRQASYKGLRLDKPAEEVVQEKPVMQASSDDSGDATSRKTDPKATAKDSTPETKKGSRGETSGSAKNTKKNKAGEPLFGKVRLSSPDKVLFPADGVTKQDVADYYWAMRKRILPYLVDRPMTLVRCTEHIGDACFFQKHQNHPIQGVDTVPIRDNDGEETEAMILRDEESLMGSVQMGAVEFHGWGSKLKQLEKPDWLVFDLDPDEGMDIEQVRQGVRDLKELLDAMDLEAYLKTSGGKGYHVVVPLKPSADWEAGRNFAKLVAQGMESKWPDRYTANMRKEKRKGRIYVDWVRNGRSATSVSIFSLRARPGAPVSWPLRWPDLDEITPNGITIRNWEDHLDTLSGWSDFFRSGQKLK